MRKTILFATLLAACTASEPRVPSEIRPVVSIDRIAGTNPLTVRGVAHSAGSLMINVRDSRGALLESVPVTPARDGSASSGVFENELLLTRDPGSQVVIEVVDPARSGSRTLARATAEHLGAAVPRVLFFPNPTLSEERCSGVYAVERVIPQSSSIARVLLAALLHGPTVDEVAEGYASPFSPGTAVRSVKASGGTIVIDFVEGSRESGDACALRESVEQTLLAIPGIRKVVITIGGRAPGGPES